MVADNILGVRSAAQRQQFEALVQMACVQVRQRAADADTAASRARRLSARAARRASLNRPP
jgi:hypothetical protein